MYLTARTLSNETLSVIGSFPYIDNHYNHMGAFTSLQGTWCSSRARWVRSDGCSLQGDFADIRRQNGASIPALMPRGATFRPARGFPKLPLRAETRSYRGRRAGYDSVPRTPPYRFLPGQTAPLRSVLLGSIAGQEALAPCLFG